MNAEEEQDAADQRISVSQLAAPARSVPRDPMAVQCRAPIRVMRRNTVPRHHYTEVRKRSHIMRPLELTARSSPSLTCEPTCVRMPKPGNLAPVSIGRIGANSGNGGMHE